MLPAAFSLRLADARDHFVDLRSKCISVSIAVALLSELKWFED